MHPLPVPGSHEYVMRTAGSVDQSVAPETTASGSQGKLKYQSPHGRRSGQSTPRNTAKDSTFALPNAEDSTFALPNAKNTNMLVSLALGGVPGQRFVPTL